MGKAGQVLDPLDFEEETAEQDPLNISHKSQIVHSNQSILGYKSQSFFVCRMHCSKDPPNICKYLNDATLSATICTSLANKFTRMGTTSGSLLASDCKY